MHLPSVTVDNFDLFSNSFQDNFSLNNEESGRDVGVTRYLKGELQEDR